MGKDLGTGSTDGSDCAATADADQKRGDERGDGKEHSGGMVHVGSVEGGPGSAGVGSQALVPESAHTFKDSDGGAGGSGPGLLGMEEVEAMRPLLDVQQYSTRRYQDFWPDEFLDESCTCPMWCSHKLDQRGLLVEAGRT